MTKREDRAEALRELLNIDVAVRNILDAVAEVV
jgi:hypothetical protein